MVVFTFTVWVRWTMDSLVISFPFITVEASVIVLVWFPLTMNKSSSSHFDLDQSHPLLTFFFVFCLSLVLVVSSFSPLWLKFPSQVWRLQKDKTSHVTGSWQLRSVLPSAFLFQWAVMNSIGCVVISHSKLTPENQTRSVWELRWKGRVRAGVSSLTKKKKKLLKQL